MKKTVSSILLASALLLGAIAPVTANADTTGNGFSGTTNSSVTFQKPDATTNPVDPNNPDQPGKGDNGDHGGTNPGGDLTFLYVSPDMDFGTAKTSSTVDKNGKTTAQTLNPEKITATVLGEASTDKLVTEVSDTRGTNAGWQVTVKSSALTSEAGDTLDGATITLGGDSANTIIKNTAGSVATGANAVLTTGAQTSTPIYTAGNGVGAGTTAMQLDASDITLGSLPANIKASETGTAYTGQLDWTLSATPQA
ncbi:WxL domain-containing protein [Levilactobacillus parabrevis]|uniref:WxL domain-containing protein n=1 Tax=Levilactobacillus parabrevis TaxID=357278 RepID=UPI0021A32519|nr:WxL domain-containing protein [Levilactobacillus parabrevis]MCT4487356.1 WxL domain-containing protein [Levilactobacillus parabrevis]MCT4490036.1 WxL domain-containing protein [Levilactobacillus parabrevis]